MDVLSYLVTERPPAHVIESPRACFDFLEPLDARFSSPVERAAAGGFVADRLGYAFLAGYRAALARLDATLSRASFCATEAPPQSGGANDRRGGGHPRAIATRLERKGDGWELTGEKTFATLASAASTLLVVASAGVREGRNQLHVARIPASRAGVEIRDREPIAFAPEIPHARVSLRAVRVEPGELLEGDGYTRFLKPFRTIEDIHVAAAWLGHVVRLARLFDEPGEIVERALAALTGLRDLAGRDPLDPAVHLALAGLFANAQSLPEELTLARADETTRTRWKRDLPLLAVAGAARELRREAAHRLLFGDESSKKPPAP